jgi:hypothetical protein
VDVERKHRAIAKQQEVNARVDARMPAISPGDDLNFVLKA